MDRVIAVRVMVRASAILDSLAQSGKADKSVLPYRRRRMSWPSMVTAVSKLERFQSGLDGKKNLSPKQETEHKKYLG
jgi:hypothetical protein